MNAVDKVYDIGVGTYDVTVAVGPSYQSKRQEAVASQLELVKAFPALMQVAPDIIIRNFDWPQADEIADRAKAMLDPRVLAATDKGDPETRLAQLQAQMGQIMQQHQQLTEALNQAHQIIQTKQVEAQSRLDIEKEKLKAQILIAEINTKAQEAQTRLQMEHEVWQELHQAGHETALSAQEHVQSQQLAQQSAQAQAAQSAQDSTQAQAAQPQTGEGE